MRKYSKSHSLSRFLCNEKTSLRWLRKRIPRSCLCQASFHSLGLEPGKRRETMAKVSAHWPILPSVPFGPCAHVYNGRKNSLWAWPSSRILTRVHLRTHFPKFSSMTGGLRTKRGRRWRPSRDAYGMSRQSPGFAPCARMPARVKTRSLSRAFFARERAGGEGRAAAFTCHKRDNCPNGGKAWEGKNCVRSLAAVAW